MATLVLTVIGDDRPGLVDGLARAIAANEGSWERSHMARLAGQFAGIVVVALPDDRIDAIGRELEALGNQGLLDITVTRATEASGEAPTAFTLGLALLGQNRPGIIREVAAALAGRNVSIVELETATESAPMSGEQLFRAQATVQLPDGADLDALRDALEEIANELMVDLDVGPPSAGTSS